MFGKMNIDKASKFYISSFPYQTFKDRISSSEYEMSLGRWDHFDRNIHTLFKRKYNTSLNVEQRWFIFTSIISSLKIDIDVALGHFARGSLREVGYWALTKDSDLILNKIKYEDFQKFSGFPHNELFNYSINNYLTVYPNNEVVKEFVTQIEKYKMTSTERETVNALSVFREYAK